MRRLELLLPRTSAGKLPVLGRAGTAVVYAWDARAAKWRLLARGSAQQQIPGAQPSATGDAVQAGQPKDDGRGETTVGGPAVEAPEGI